MKRSLFAVGLAIVLGISAANASASIFITEVSRGGIAGEFVEILNTGPAAVDMTGWSFDDASATKGAFSISGLGTLNSGQVGIISELPAATFRANWGNLPDSVKVVGGNDQNLGNGDGMNIFNADSTTPVATVNYPGGNAVIDGETWSVGPAFYGLNDFTKFSRSASGDAFGSFISTVGSGTNYFGNPGTAAVPEPASIGLIGAIAWSLNRSRRAMRDSL